MSTIPKAIQEKIEAVALGLYPIYEGELEKYNWESEPCRKDYIAAAIYGYQLATDGREELEKECDFWKRECATYRDGCQNRDNQITALQSQCTEKEKECEELKNQLDIIKLENSFADEAIEELKEAFLCPHCGQLINHP